VNGIGNNRGNKMEKSLGEILRLVFLHGIKAEKLDMGNNEIPGYTLGTDQAKELIIKHYCKKPTCEELQDCIDTAMWKDEKVSIIHTENSTSLGLDITVDEFQKLLSTAITNYLEEKR